MTEPVAQIAEGVNFLRRIVTIVLLGCVLAGGAFGARTYFHDRQDRDAARAACLDAAWHTAHPDEIEAAADTC
jgi:hypothetical protein